MVTIDFFVHPEHADPKYCRSSDRDIEIYLKYLGHLTSIARASDYAVLLNGMRPNSIFEEVIRQERRFDTFQECIEGESYDSGFIVPDEFPKIELILSNADFSEIRVHGSFWTQCPEGLAVQLFWYLKRNERLEIDSPDEEVNKKIKKAVELYERKGDFAHCAIKYGVVLAHPDATLVIKPSRNLITTLINPMKRNGNLTYQLMDSGTVVYGP